MSALRTLIKVDSLRRAEAWAKQKGKTDVADSPEMRALAGFGEVES